MLELRDIRAGYGEAIVLDGVSLAVPQNGSLALLGRNGVGKSTLLLTIMGYTRLHRGELLWNGTSISRLAPQQPDLIASDGLHPSGKMYALWVKLALPQATQALAKPTTAPAKPAG